jgi:hypothetical protein
MTRQDATMLAGGIRSVRTLRALLRKLDYQSKGYLFEEWADRHIFIRQRPTLRKQVTIRLVDNPGLVMRSEKRTLDFHQGADGGVHDTKAATASRTRLDEGQLEDYRSMLEWCQTGRRLKASDGTWVQISDVWYLFPDRESARLRVAGLRVGSGIGVRYIDDNGMLQELASSQESNP